MFVNLLVESLFKYITYRVLSAKNRSLKKQVPTCKLYCHE